MVNSLNNTKEIIWIQLYHYMHVTCIIVYWLEIIVQTLFARLIDSYISHSESQVKLKSIIRNVNACCQIIVTRIFYFPSAFVLY